ncbi:hypothetical protein, partial [uncultured Treponema sp.]
SSPAPMILPTGGKLGRGRLFPYSLHRASRQARVALLFARAVLHGNPCRTQVKSCFPPANMYNFNMTKEFSNWTDYDHWLIADYGMMVISGKERMATNYDKYFINKIEEIDGKIVVEYEEANTPR